MTFFYNVKYYLCSFGFHNVYFKVYTNPDWDDKIFQIDRVTDNSYTEGVTEDDIVNMQATYLYHAKREVTRKDWDRFMVERELSK